MSESFESQTQTPPAAADRWVEQWSEADPERRRELITAAALSLLHERGLKAVTMRRVAERLGVGAMTLYTYIENQRELHRAMMRRGFEMLDAQCKAASTLGTPEGWRGGSRAYLRFAMEHPNLYKLMFDAPTTEEDHDLLRGGFEPLLEKVQTHLAAEGLSGEALRERALAAARRYWIALHGLAMLMIAGRLGGPECEIDPILDDMLPRIAPTA